MSNLLEIRGILAKCTENVRELKPVVRFRCYISLTKMVTMSQNASNHLRFFPLHHFIISPAVVGLIIWSAVRLGKGEDALFELLVAVLLLLISLAARIYGLKNQDRIIRMEMRQRYFELTGKRFMEKEKQLRLSQIIALRFASDDEFLELLDRAIEDKLSAKEIKLAIRDWQADLRRV
jgi:hypothetical protein